MGCSCNKQKVKTSSQERSNQSSSDEQKQTNNKPLIRGGKIIQRKK
jgi:hypothetical protein